MERACDAESYDRAAAEHQHRGINLQRRHQRGIVSPLDIREFVGIPSPAASRNSVVSTTYSSTPAERNARRCGHQRSSTPFHVAAEIRQTCQLTTLHLERGEETRPCTGAQTAELR